MVEELNSILAVERRKRIAQLVESNGSINYADLERSFGVSRMTLYRDLKALEGMNRLRCVRGGAVRLDNAVISEPMPSKKRALHRREKELIGRFAAQNFVREGDFIVLEAGTTAACMIKHLARPGVTLISNGLETIREATNLLPTVTVMGCGGILREPSYTFVGPQAEMFFAQLRAHTAFLSASGLTLENGLMDPNPLEIQVKRAMVACAERLVVLMDSSKFGVRSLLQTLPLDQVDVLITDDRITDKFAEELRARGIDLRVVLA
ncbi:MAG: DeoR/GlpR family DNA-binding transcription regulator [Meiothermus sp.]|nr:DeoR/GlpR family DNA-binding transcription regulator [Meiothermus sp.]